MSEFICAAATCVGSGIAQSVVSSLRAASLPVRLIGFGDQPFDYGALDCDEHHLVPPIASSDYVDVLLEKCQDAGVNVVIPGLDQDVLALSAAEARFQRAGIDLIAPPHPLAALCRDKEQLSLRLREAGAPFVPTFSKKTLEGGLKRGEISLPCVAKPRDGSGSQGVRLVERLEELDHLSERMVFQPLLRPRRSDRYFDPFQEAVDNGKVPQYAELSVQVVTGREGELLGRMATINNLKQGVPVQIFPAESREIWESAERVRASLSGLGLRGPLNLQGRVTEEGVRLFEVNPRFTGITGLRALFGFNEVEACVRSWFDFPRLKLPGSGRISKFGLRQVEEKAVCISGDPAAEEYAETLRNDPVPDRKVLLLTGSTGFLGRRLVPTLDLERYRIWVLSTDPARARQLFDERVEHCFAAGDFSGAGIPWGSVDLLLHAGFARPYRPQREIAGSLAYTQKLFGLASRLEIPGVIYISSQSVYGQAAEPPWQEGAPLAPESPYAAAKYAGELMLERIRGEKPHLRTAAVRLAGLTGGQPGLVGVDLVSRFVKQALEGVPLEIQGEHVFERLDVRDAVNGLRALLRVPRADWQAVYNLGSGSSFSIRELARTVVEQVSRFTGEPPVEVELDLRDPPLKFEMDSRRFFRQTGWKPEYTLSDTIQSLIRYHLER